MEPAELANFLNCLHFLVLFKMRLSQKFFNCLSKVLGSDGELW